MTAISLFKMAAINSKFKDEVLITSSRDAEGQELRKGGGGIPLSNSVGKRVSVTSHIARRV